MLKKRLALACGLSLVIWIVGFGQSQKQGQSQNPTSQTPAAPAQGPTEINTLPLKDIKQIVLKAAARVQSGEIKAPKTFSFECGFKVEPDGSLTHENIRIITSTGSKPLDETALMVLWNIGQSHILGLLSGLTDMTIRFDLAANDVRVVIGGIAADEDSAKAKDKTTRFLLGLLRVQQQRKNHPDVVQLLSLIRSTQDGKRVALEGTLTRQQASDLMRQWITPAPPQ